MLLAVLFAAAAARRKLSALDGNERARLLSSVLNVASLQLDDEEEGNSKRDSPLERVLKLAVDNPLDDFTLENPAKRLGKLRTQRQKLLKRAKKLKQQKLKKKMKLAKLSRKNRLPVELNAPIQSEPENIVKVDSPFMMHDVMQPVTSPGQAKKARKNQSK